MARLYLTHDPAELVMAYIFAVLTAFNAYAAWTASPELGAMRWLGFAFVSPGIAATYMFLFHMSGSRKRREAAESEPEKARA